jgi:hypothetical protein
MGCAGHSSARRPNLISIGATSGRDQPGVGQPTVAAGSVGAHAKAKAAMAAMNGCSIRLSLLVTGPSIY